MINMDIVGLKKIMIDRGVCKNIELSKKSGISRDTIGKILNGSIQPSSAVMGKLIATLQIPPEEAGKIFFNTNLLNTQEMDRRRRQNE